MLRTVVISVLCLLGVSSTSADIVKMNDGREFEGTIVEETSGTIRIDAMVSGIRATLTLNVVEIKSSEKKSVSGRFYEPPKAAKRISDPKNFGVDDTLYLEVPIVGDFGKTVVREGVSAALAYSRAHRIGHVVFIVDSKGGDLDETSAIHKLLGAYDSQLAYHAIIRNCRDDALVIPVWCDTVSLLPGATVGGTDRHLASTSDKTKGEDEAVLRQQIATEAAQVARKRGRPGYIIKAMIDPAEVLVAWKEGDGELKFGESAPDSVSKSDVKLSVKAGELLTVNYKQAIAIGMPPFNGRTVDLGKALGIESWKTESDYGHKAMTKAAKNRAKSESRAKSVFDTKVKNNIARRETTERFIAHNMKQAANWSPNKASYATYKSYSNRWNWGWGRGYGNYDVEEYETNRLTAESRRKWQHRTDASIHYLRETRKGCLSMRRLDKEAKSIGLKTSYKDGELDLMIKDIEKKVVYLIEHRRRTTN